jgi:hypothetical protein
MAAPARMAVVVAVLEAQREAEARVVRALNGTRLTAPEAAAVVEGIVRARRAREPYTAAEAQEQAEPVRYPVQMALRV